MTTLLTGLKQKGFFCFQNYLFSCTIHIILRCNKIIINVIFCHVVYFGLHLKLGYNIGRMQAKWHNVHVLVYDPYI